MAIVYHSSIVAAGVSSYNGSMDSVFLVDAVIENAVPVFNVFVLMRTRMGEVVLCSCG